MADIDADNNNPAEDNTAQEEEQVEETVAPEEPVSIPFPSLPDDYFDDDELSDVETDGKIFNTEQKLVGHNLNSWSTTKFPGLSGLNDNSLSRNDKSRVNSCLQMGNGWRNNPQADPPFVVLSRGLKRKPLVRIVINRIEAAFLTMEVVQKDGIIVAIKPQQKHIKDLGRYLGEILNIYRAEFIIEGLPIPPLPMWGPKNEISEWWYPEEFEIIATCYRKDVEDFIGAISPFAPKRIEDQEPIQIPVTPAAALGSISNNPQRQLRFEAEDIEIPFVSNSAYLGNIIKGQAPLGPSARSRPSAPLTPTSGDVDASLYPASHHTPISRTRNHRPAGFSLFGGAPDPGDDGSDSDSLSSSPSN